jgi:hypothetical protein
MRSVPKLVALVLALLVLFVPLVAYASDEGPCPDDLEMMKDCDQEAPPHYVVINRSVEFKDRPGTGCQPIILKNPECKDCTGPDCTTIDVETEVCKPLLAGKVPSGETQIVYEMCCACASNPEGDWAFRIRDLDSEGNCPISQDNPDWIRGLPAGTGIDLPAPIIAAALAVAGLGLLVLGVVLRRRATATA